MNRDDVVAEFGDTVLAQHNFFERDTTGPREVGIRRMGDSWAVYKTDERGAEGRKTFDNEADALDFFARLLRGFILRRLDRAW